MCAVCVCVCVCVCAMYRYIYFVSDSCTVLNTKTSKFGFKK